MISYSDFAANLMTRAITKHLANGRMRLYSGPRPASANLPTTIEHEFLAELWIAHFDPPHVGIATATVADGLALVGGTATWFRCWTPDGRVLMDGSVGDEASDADLQFNDCTVLEGENVSIRTFRFTVPVD